MSNSYRISGSFIVIFFLFFQSFCSAQLNRGNDTSYYEYFPGSVTTRFYFSQKYTDFIIKAKDVKDLHYRPNTTLNMGVGATYHNFSLNLAYGFPFLNQDDDKGKTKYLDLQGHFYKPETVVDFYGQLYKGYHLNGSYNPLTDSKYSYRPDARVTLFGLSYYHIFNSKRFSYRAALIQNEWQKKSAGSFLLGVEAYYGIMRDDSAWVPQSVATSYPQQGITKVNYFSIGPGVGYAYTLVLFHHIYFTGSATGNLNFNITTEHRTDEKSNRFSIAPLTRWRVATGYNGRLWNVSANWVADYLPFHGEAEESKYALQTGNYRLIIARRLFPGPKLQRLLRVPDKVFKE